MLDMTPQEMIDHINHNEHKIGDIVYYVTWTCGQNPIKIVRFGTVLENYTSSMCVQLYSGCDMRRINGIPFDEFPDATDFQKLPKKWTYNTKLFDCEEVIPQEAYFDIKDPDDIRRCINAGYLVPWQARDHRYVDTDIQKGIFRLVKKSGSGIFDCGIHGHYNPESRSPYISLSLGEAFSTFEEARAVVTAYYDELKRVSELTDEEYTKEEIEHVTGRWAKIYNIQDDEKQKVIDFLLAQDNLGDIEVRLFDGMVQWKYWKKKRWMTVMINE